MEYVAVFEEKVTLTPKDLRNEIKSIDNILEQKLRKQLEGRCSRNGYVLPDGISILSRSMGNVERGRFTGNLLFHVQAEGKVLNPPDGTIVSGEVIRKNKMGLYVEYAKAIRIIIPRDINIGNKEFEDIEIGEMVDVEIKKSRFQVNDEYILSVGLFKHRSRGPTKNVYAADEDTGDDKTTKQRTNVRNDTENTGNTGYETEDDDNGTDEGVGTEEGVGADEEGAEGKEATDDEGAATDDGETASAVEEESLI